MIGRISGILLEKNPLQLLIDCQGIAYEVDVPMSTFYQLPGTGEKVTLYTHLIVREDAHLLYGFMSTGERSLFRQLIRISGIGARIALAVLSGMSVNDVSQAIVMQDTARLTQIPGIGKKTAERLLLELRGKMELSAGVKGDMVPLNDALSDIRHALMSLGYSEKEATLATRELPADANVSDGIKLALKTLSKA